MQTNLLKPKAIQVEQLGHNRAKVTLEPFERGYGHTLGNALRRVLLSSMVGYAVTDVTIAGVLHEYSSIDGVQEDVVNILLNLKGVVFKLHNRDEVTLSLRKDGEGQVTAADIQTPHDVEIINPEHVIANLSQGGKIDIQLKVEKGRGYVPGSMRRHADEVNKSIGRIVLDASFSPVKRVSYSVENARVEQRTDLDRLVVEIETNGAINAEDAVRSSAKILVEQLAVFAQLEGNELAAFDSPAPRSAQQFDPILLRPVDELEQIGRASCRERVLHTV
jgi:DNA-directed RNA polymerase subunit alpha